MEKIPGYNRNLMGGKRPHKKIQRYGRYKTLAERLVAESAGLEAYLNRVGLSKKNNKEKIGKKLYTFLKLKQQDRVTRMSYKILENSRYGR